MVMGAAGLRPIKAAAKILPHSTPFTHPMTTTYPLHDALTRADESFPEHADVVIAGAGIMGCAAAYYLARRGLKAVVVDKSRIAGQQSTRAWGFVRQQGREAAEVPLMMAGIRLWEQLEAELDFDLEWRQGGCLYVASEERDWASFQQWIDVARQYGARYARARPRADRCPRKRHAGRRARRPLHAERRPGRTAACRGGVRRAGGRTRRALLRRLRRRGGGGRRRGDQRRRGRAGHAPPRPPF